MRKRLSALGEKELKPSLRRSKSVRLAIPLKIAIPQVLVRGSGLNAYHVYEVQVNFVGIAHTFCNHIHISHVA